MKTLKQEEIRGNEYRDLNHLRNDIIEFVGMSDRMSNCEMNTKRLLLRSNAVQDATTLPPIG